MKSSAPAACLQLLVAVGRAGEFLLQTRGEVRVGVLPELLQVVEQRVARRQHVRAGHVLAEFVAAALSRSREAAIAGQIDEPRFPAIEIDAGRTTARGESAGSAGAPPSVSMKRLSRADERRRGQVGEAVELGDQAIDLAHRDRTAAAPTGAENRATSASVRPAVRSRSIGPSALAAAERRSRCSAAARAAVLRAAPSARPAARRGTRVRRRDPPAARSGRQTTDRRAPRPGARAAARRRSRGWC